MEERKLGYIIATDYVKADGVEPVSDKIQALIDENPNKTIYFPDGRYLFDKPIYTPAEPQLAVALRLANFAVFSADSSWNTEWGAIVHLGGKNPSRDAHNIGSCYGIDGGVLDGNGVADGVSVDSGRESRISNLSIKNTRIGVFIKYGSNSGSSDVDVINVHITGNGAQDSVGVYLEGLDNSLTNMRIANVQIGVYLKSAGNYLRHIHPLYTCKYENYQESCGFYDVGGNNFLTNCYSDHFAVGFRSVNGRLSTMDTCFVCWYCDREVRHTAIKADKQFNYIVSNFNILFLDPSKCENIVLAVGEKGGQGVIDRVVMDEKKCSDKVYKKYLKGGVFCH